MGPAFHNEEDDRLANWLSLSEVLSEAHSLVLSGTVLSETWSVPPRDFNATCSWESVSVISVSVSKRITSSFSDNSLWILQCVLATAFGKASANVSSKSLHMFKQSLGKHLTKFKPVSETGFGTESAQHLVSENTQEPIFNTTIASARRGTNTPRRGGGYFWVSLTHLQIQGILRKFSPNKTF